MDTWKILLIAAGSAAAITLLVLLAAKMKSSNVQDDETILKKCFGEPVLSSSFSFRQAKEWLLQRKEKITSGHKGVILKATPETLRSFGSEYEIKLNAENYLVIAIVDMANHDISDSVLIKYNSLDDELTKKLDAGNGVLVIGG